MPIYSFNSLEGVFGTTKLGRNLYFICVICSHSCKPLAIWNVAKHKHRNNLWKNNKMGLFYLWRVEYFGMNFIKKIIATNLKKKEWSCLVICILLAFDTYNLFINIVEWLRMHAIKMYVQDFGQVSYIHGALTSAVFPGTRNET